MNQPNVGQLSLHSTESLETCASVRLHSVNHVQDCSFSGVAFAISAKLKVQLRLMGMSLAFSHKWRRNWNLNVTECEVRADERVCKDSFQSSGGPTDYHKSYQSMAPSYKTGRFN